MVVSPIGNASVKAASMVISLYVPHERRHEIVKSLGSDVQLSFTFKSATVGFLNHGTESTGTLQSGPATNSPDLLQSPHSNDGGIVSITLTVITQLSNCIPPFSFWKRYTNLYTPLVNLKLNISSSKLFNLLTGASLNE